MTGFFKTISALALVLSTAGWTRASGDDCEVQRALEIVSGALELRQDQREGVRVLLVERQLITGPRSREIEALQRRLQELLQSGANPTLVGETMIEIQHRQNAIGLAQADFHERFAGLLDDAQRGRFHQFLRAAELSPVLPAFRRLQLI